MTLPISNEHFNTRWNILRRIYDYKWQLTAAYQAHSSRRVYIAKRGLIRYLYRLVDSPELGEPPVFHWTPELAAIIQFGIDSELSASILSIHSYRRVAEELERSLDGG